MNALLSGSGPEMDTMGQDLSPLGWASSITNSRLFHHSPSGMTKAPHRGHTFFFFFFMYLLRPNTKVTRSYRNNGAKTPESCVLERKKKGMTPIHTSCYFALLFSLHLFYLSCQTALYARCEQTYTEKTPPLFLSTPLFLHVHDEDEANDAIQSKFYNSTFTRSEWARGSTLLGYWIRGNGFSRIFAWPLFFPPYFFFSFSILRGLEMERMKE